MRPPRKPARRPQPPYPLPSSAKRIRGTASIQHLASCHVLLHPIALLISQTACAGEKVGIHQPDGLASHALPAGICSRVGNNAAHRRICNADVRWDDRNQRAALPELPGPRGCGNRFRQDGGVPASGLSRRRSNTAHPSSSANAHWSRRRLPDSRADPLDGGGVRSRPVPAQTHRPRLGRRSPAAGGFERLWSPSPCAGRVPRSVAFPRGM